MDLINWSLNAIDTIFSTRSTGSGEPNIEDIYLFGTMITGLLLIGLGFALGYRKIKDTGTAVQSFTRLPVMIEAVGRAVSIETETINAIWILSRKSSRLWKGKLTETRTDNMSSWEIWNAVTRPKTKQAQSYLFRLPSATVTLDKGRYG